MGGLSKKAFQFAEISREHNLPTLILDGGSLLFKDNPINKNQEQQDKITASGIIKAYNKIGYDAVGVSGQDLAAGLDYLTQLSKESDFTWLSANIFNDTSSLPLFTPAISRQIDNLKINILGLTSRLAAKSAPLGKDIIIKPWQDVLPPLLDKLSQENDFTILLTDISDAKCKEIAQLFPAINLIIQANNNNSSQAPVNLSETAIKISTGKKGKYIGILKVSCGPGSKWQETGGTKSRYTNSFVAMEKSLPDDLPVLEIVNHTTLEINKSNSKSSRAFKDKMYPAREFVGWQKCRGCHPDQADRWQKTGHAASFLTLTAKNQQFNPNCLPCHVTAKGLLTPTGSSVAPVFQMVSCESCHGPGRRHSTNHKANKTKPVSEMICLNCHVPDHDDSFNFPRDLQKLKCGF